METGPCGPLCRITACVFLFCRQSISMFTAMLLFLAVQTLPGECRFAAGRRGHDPLLPRRARDGKTDQLEPTSGISELRQAEEIAAKLQTLTVDQSLKQKERLRSLGCGCKGQP